MITGEPTTEKGTVWETQKSYSGCIIE